jgi:hypothetical protein
MAFDFEPLEEAPPAEGVVVDLAVPNTSQAEEVARLRAARELNPFVEADVRETLAPGLTDSPDDVVGANDLCISQPRITLVVGYPFAGQYAVTIRADSPEGFTRADLFRQIARVHSAMYDGATLSAVEHLDNTRVDSPRFGTAWHVLGDLVLEEVLLQTRGDGRVFAWIYIGS